MKRSLTFAAALASTAAVTLPQAADAATYCVAKPSCVAGGGSNAVTLDAALAAAGKLSKGPDRIEIGPGDFVAPHGWEYWAKAGEGVDVVGSGRGLTRLESAGTTNGVEITLRILGVPESSVSDLSIVAPGPLGSGSLAIGLATSATVQRVDVSGASGYAGIDLQKGGSLVDSTVLGSGARPAIMSTEAQTSVTRSSIKTPGTAISAASGADLRVSRTTIEAGQGTDVSGTGTLSIDDSLITTHGGPGLATETGANTNLTAVNDTVVGDGSSIGVLAGDGGAGHKTHVTLQNTIVSNYVKSLRANSAGGAVDVTVRGSDWDAAIQASAGQVDASQANLHVDPGFVDAAGGDFHLRADSPLIDAGIAAGSSDRDLGGAMRALDGNGDGVAAPDIGAYEAPAVPLKPQSPDPAAPPVQTPPVQTPVVDTSAPYIKSLKFVKRRFRVVLS